MVPFLMLLEQVPFFNSHWSVFNLRELPGSEELTLFKSLSNILLDCLFRMIKKGMYYTLEWKKEKRNNILKILNLLTLTQKVRITREIIPACEYT